VTKIESSYLCVYGHFSQPPRGNPLTQVVGIEADAAPNRNWNERVLNACYRPNAQAGNFEHISFSFGQALMSWLKRRAPDVYDTITEADKQAAAQGAGNALATAYNHIILPLARKRDRRTQIQWGIAAFEQHYGRAPLGFWLPEMAVDQETLLLLVEAGIKYTVLAQQQMHDLPFHADAGPYRINLGKNKHMDVFVRNDHLSTDLSFNIHNLGGAGHWSHTELIPARKDVKALLVATAGETFGHHFAGEEQFLYWLVKHEAASVGYEMISLDGLYARQEAKHTVTIEDPSSWSDERGLASWATGQVTAKGDTTWRGALRRALDNVASEIDRAYEDLTRRYKIDPWTLRDVYAPVLLGVVSAEAFLEQHAPTVTGDDAAALKNLLSAQELAQRMYSSYSFTAERLDSAQPRYSIACAAAALTIAQQATGHDMGDRLLSDFTVVTAPGTPVTGLDILRSVIEEFDLGLKLTS
jgi:alpha-amylase/alpha-mannosidase (GH57 family)